MLVPYLRERGKVQMSDLLPSAMQGVLHQLMNRYAKIAKVQNILGWDCLMEGRILSILMQHQHEHIRNMQNQMTTKRWVEGMIQQLTGVVHRQWVHRNTLVHFQRQGGVSRNQFDALVRRVEELVVIEPDEMLEGDRSLLKVNQDTLGKMCPTKKKHGLQRYRL